MKRILLDENLPRPLIKHFSENFQVFTVPDMGWASKKNGELLHAMTEEGIDILLTVDRNLQYQQNLKKYAVIVVVIVTHDNRYKTLASHIPNIEAEILGMNVNDKVLKIDVRK